MISTLSNFQLRLLTGIVSISLVTMLYVYASHTGISLLILGCLLWILSQEWPAIIGSWSLQTIAFTLIYPGFFCAALLLLNKHPQHHILLPLILLMTFGNDACAYVVGKLVGKHKLAPSISPKKTIEGFIGGCIGTLLLTSWYTGLPLTYLVIFCLLVSIIATIGDLFESYLKRKAGVKDSGALLPGHGGLLDRCDSLLFVGMFFYLFASDITAFLGF